MLLLFATALAAEPATPPLVITLDGNRVLMDGVRKPLNHAKPFLIANPGSRKRAKGAKALSTLGTVTVISGAAVAVLGLAALSTDDSGRTNPGAISLVSTGLVIECTGLIMKVSSHQKWKKSVKDYAHP